MFGKNQTISQLTSTGSDLSERTKILVKKNIEQLELNEIAFLLREYVGTGVCIPIAVNRLKEQEINISMLHRNQESENQRELIRELVLIETGSWDINAIANQELKEILGIKIDYLNIRREIKEQFKAYTPKELMWKQSSIQEFNYYMTDSRMGVLYGYGLVTSLKRAILNGNSVKYEMGSDSVVIKTMSIFNELVILKLNCNDELLRLLENEKKIKE